MKRWLVAMLFLQILAIESAWAHSAADLKCLQLLAIAKQSDKGIDLMSAQRHSVHISPEAKTFLRLFKIGLDNISSDRTDLIKNLQASSLSRHPTNPFLNLDSAIGRALSAKVERLLPDLEQEWEDIRSSLALQLRALAHEQKHKEQDRVATRAVRDLVRVAVDERYFGRGNPLPAFLYDGQSESDYFIATQTRDPWEGKRRRFRISKRHFTLVDTTHQSEPTGREHSEINYIVLGHLMGWAKGYSVKYEYINPNTLTIWLNRFNDQRLNGPLQISFSYQAVGAGPSPQSVMLAMESRDDQGDSLLFMHKNQDADYLRLTVVDKASWTERPVKIQGERVVDHRVDRRIGRTGHWSVFKNQQGEILLQFRDYERKAKDLDLPREVTLWSFDRSTDTFKLEFHEVIPQGNGVSSVLIDYESKSLVGMVLNDNSLMVYRDVDISAGEAAP